ncbi:hypothetical protein DS6A_25 [Mycobacterium phage DS6A]|uniref:Glycine-rich domain-containing protein n=1 Tax=Mycobacterium phage DS6A TaxID=45764 RepID=G8I4D5_9CAUD|nr:hypothetical protein DS6A_25 [Mycobacterium phage DS6A]AER47579.1 hypothetical protein DS6A_25 [Mycobacterium phage DS6A]
MATIRATFTDAEGEPAVGYVQFEPRYLRNAVLAPTVRDGMVAPVRLRFPLDDGELEADLEPGDYNVAVVLQYARTIYAVATVPLGSGVINLRDLLSAYMPVPQRATNEYSTPGDEIEWAIPFGATKIDVVLLGAGGGGDPGDLFVGGGGLCGAWLGITLERGVDFPGATQAVSGVIGVGGASGEDGADTTLTVPGITNPAAVGGLLKADGGLHGANKGTLLGTPDQPISWGQAVAPFEFNGRTYEGGQIQTMWGGDGFGPGGGGSGGFSYSPGGAGAGGKIWLTGY